MIRAFNAVVEGTYSDEWRHLNYKLTQLDVPANVRAINDGVYRYELIGTTRDFQSLAQISEDHETDLEAAVGFLAWCDGVVLPYTGGQATHILERPRAVIMRGGRVYIDEHMKNDQGYMKVVEEHAIKKAGELFGNQSLTDKLVKLYESQMQSS